MTSSQLADPRPRRIPWILVAGLVAVSAIAVANVYPMLSSASSPPPSSFRVPSSRRASSSLPSPSTAASRVDVRRADGPGVPGRRPDIRGGHAGRHLESRGALGEADGVVPDGTTVFDAAVPGVANLDRDLL